MAPDEFAGHLFPVTNEAVKQAFEHGLYSSYPAGNDELPGTFGHEYSGKKVLVTIDKQTGKEQFLKNL